ncbi:hypothetical protein MPTK1_5g17840 [Marchantia polymorpha subsp. ruderalis]|uniref:Secreted protein n=2 Tax=Marchantia polymorpha TaxID=3197 RepID=A0AAF6BJH2_MARPO|nr:hypothetical protein MARPO_3284s0001 [Marchantia polymorpha]BBN12156.1 hypothetical protein Mp_5g17840 [Marchantia polymorpha subsp. ruderalis]|eukprot:PTQ26295.1 hypothetical protein MARPO_3284s0001 [Marchantia polymorpha]
MRITIPFSAFWLRSSVVSVLISLISDTRVIDPHDINLISLTGASPTGQLAVSDSPASPCLYEKYEVLALDSVRVRTFRRQYLDVLKKSSRRSQTSV